MILRAVAAIALLTAILAAAAPTPRSVQLGLTDGRVAPASAAVPTGAPVQADSTGGLFRCGRATREACATTSHSPAPHLIPPACSPSPCPTLTPRPKRGPTLAGTATWYRTYYGTAAAGPALRAWLGPHWRYTRVSVTAPGCDCPPVVVLLSDWCACPGGRIIDLDYRAFANLAPLSRGVLAVRVARAP